MRSFVPAFTSLAVCSGAFISAQTSTIDEGAKVILKRYIDALGGFKALSSHVSEERISEVTMLGKTDRSLLIRDLKDGRSYSRTEPQSASFSTVEEEGFDGKQVWEKTSLFQGIKPASDAEKDRQRYLRKPLWRFEQDLDTQYRKLPDMEIKGTMCQAIEASSHGVKRQFYFDSGTGLLRASRAESQLTHYGDYRVVDGVKIAFQERIDLAPGTVLMEEVQSLKFNIPLDPKLFAWKGTSEPQSGPSFGVESFEIPKHKYLPDEEIPEEIRLKTLEVVWQRVKNGYFDASFNGVNWDQQIITYRSRVSSAKTSEAFHNLLQEMVNVLDRSHIRVGAPHETQLVGVDQDGSVPTVGSVKSVRLRWLENKVVIDEVDPGSPAWLAGLRPGDAIEQVNGRSLDEMMKVYKKAIRKSYRPGMKEISAVGDSLTGPSESKVQLNVLDVHGDSKVISVQRSPAPKGDHLFVLQALPPFKELPDGIGYLKVPSFSIGIKTQVASALEMHPKIRGLVLDLRKNSGGIGDLALELASLFHRENGVLAKNSGRTGETEVRFHGTGKTAFTKPLVILVDEGTASTAELFAAGLQENQRAIVLGVPTAGAVLPSVAIEIPTGGHLVLPVGESKTPKGVVLEGRGVIPNEIIEPSRQDLALGKDPVLDRAIAHLSNKLAAMK